MVVLLVHHPQSSWGPPGMAGVCSVSGTAGAIVVGIPSALAGGVFGALAEGNTRNQPLAHE